MAAREQNLYQIYKLSSTFICDSNLDIKNYTRKQAMADGAIVSLGDSIMLDRLRFLKGETRSSKEIFEYTQKLRAAAQRAKREGRDKEARICNQVLSRELFVEDVVTIDVKKKSEYRRLAKAGFYLNGKHFVRFSASAGQLRHNVTMFVNEKYFEPLYKILMCGIDEKVKEINMGKLSAYFALASSSILWVDTPRVCVVKDFETTLPKQKVDWIKKDENGVGDVEVRELDVSLNSADGQGLVDPQWSAHWAANMSLDYVPSSFVVRSAFVKGNLVPFDFKEYAAANGITRIYDRWGVGYNIEDIDVILSESQFKMYKYYSSWQEYLEYFERSGIKWGVARYNREKDDEWVMANYQHIQVLNLTPEEIGKLVEPTIDWLKKICSGEELYALLYSLGGFDDTEEIDYKDVYSRAQNLAMKAVVKDVRFLQDSYVQRKIYRNIVEAITRAKIGKIWTSGNYQFMLSDPIAQCRSALGLDPTGEIPADHVYCNFWNERGVTGEVLTARNPCIDAHELNPCTLYRSKAADYWYRYIKSGVIFSIYDTSTMRLSDADFDGDVCYTTDNPFFVKGTNKYQTNVITYEKVSAPLHKINHHNYVESDIRGFGSKVGTYSNYATVIEAMKALFTKPEQRAQRDELQRRKKLLREIVGAEIDSGKGLAKPKVPWEFTHFMRVQPDDDDIVKAEKYAHNSMVISKKPYFFRYLYPELNKKYKQYERSYDEVSRCLFGIKFKKLLIKEDKTEAEMRLVRRYHKFSPLINSNCTMNILCRKIEDVDFDIQYGKKSVSMLPTFEGEFECDEEVLTKIRDLYRKYSNRRAVAYLTTLYDTEEKEDDYDEARFGILDAIRDDIQEELSDMGLSSRETLFYIGQLSKKYKKFNWAFAWDVMGDSILSCIEDGVTVIPVEDTDGKEYLGKRYSLRVIDKKKEGEENGDDNGLQD